MDAQLRGLLELQRKRCQAHAQWEHAFDGLLRGTVHVAMFDTMVHTILQEMQSISTAMRTARDSDVDAATAPLRTWVSELQQQERSLYEATVRGQQAVVKHLLSPPSQQPPSSPGVTTVAVPANSDGACASAVQSASSDSAEVSTADTGRRDAASEEASTSHCWDCAVANLAVVRRSSCGAAAAAADVLPPVVIMKHLSVVDGENTLEDDDDGEDDEATGDGVAAVRVRVGVARNCAAASLEWASARKARQAAKQLIADLMDEAAELLIDPQ